MICRQITHDDLGRASYLIGDEQAGIAAVVDPRFEIDEYLDLARYMGVNIEHVLETHNHADHVSRHGRPGGRDGREYPRPRRRPARPTTSMSRSSCEPSCALAAAGVMMGTGAARGLSSAP